MEREGQEILKQLIHFSLNFLRASINIGIYINLFLRAETKKSRKKEINIDDLWRISAEKEQGLLKQSVLVNQVCILQKKYL